MRIALVHPFHWDDVARGGERYVADLSWWLGSQGHVVDVVTGTEGEPSTTVAGQVTVRRVPHVLGREIRGRSVPRADSFGIAALAPMLRRRYDVVHAMTPSAALAARAAGQRTLFTVLGHPTPEQYAGRPGTLRLLRAAVRRATAVAAFSAPSAAAVTAMCGGRDCLVLPLGVRVDEFPPRLDPRQGPPRLLFAGSPDVERKGLDVTLEALASLLASSPEARLVVPGEQWQVERAATRAGVAGVTGVAGVLAHVDAIGPQPMARMPELYRNATLSVLPARWEALGISLVESLASGTPIVCWDDAGAGEIPRDADVDADVGIASPVGDVDGLVDALHDVIDLAARPGTAAACVAHARRWDWSVLGPRHEQVYAALVSRRRRG